MRSTELRLRQCVERTAPRPVGESPRVKTVSIDQSEICLDRQPPRPCFVAVMFTLYYLIYLSIYLTET